MAQIAICVCVCVYVCIQKCSQLLKKLQSRKLDLIDQVSLNAGFFRLYFTYKIKWIKTRHI